MQIKIPEYARKAVEMLEGNGFEAYCVGGCVRDSLLGKTPYDWDICTNALPEQMRLVFSDFRIVETGLKHGTVTVIIDRNPVEITTYRTESGYEDHRRPSSVSFITSLDGDLSRRDFTVNAMCYNPADGLVDMFGGAMDLQCGIIRSVGDPEKRFEEDALRILRALRFAAVLDFEIEERTKLAIFAKKQLLECISRERIFVELKKLLCGKNAVNVLLEFKEVIAVFIPELAACFGFEQNNPHHIYDVWEHICRSVGYSRPEPIIRLTMLLHDVSKPELATVDKYGINHFKKHQFRSAETAVEILKRLHCDNASMNYIHDLIWEHDNRIPAQESSVKRFISKYSFEFFMDYLEVRRADTYAQSDFLRTEKLRELDSLAMLAIDIDDSGACLKTADLAADGNDMKALGLDGRQIGEALAAALDAVISGEISNKKDEIISFVKGLRQG